MLMFGVNGIAAMLALANLVTYCAVYTPMKRLSTANTSLGAVVGAIPPMIGWSAATGTLSVGELSISAMPTLTPSLLIIVKHLLKFCNIN